MFENLNPYDRPTAIVEILIMLIVAFIIGFLIAWLLKRNKRGGTSEAGTIDAEVLTLKKQLKDLESENTSLVSDKSRLKAELEARMAVKEEQGIINTPPVDTVPVAEYESLTSKFNTLQSDFDVLNKEKSSLKMELEDCLNAKEILPSPVPSSTPDFVTENIGIAPPTVPTIDDLKRIRGIGPFIEKKLNAVGIYTFEQISKFDKNDIHTVTEAIAFFPGRIERDDWVGQAGKLKDGIAIKG